MNQHSAVEGASPSGVEIKAAQAISSSTARSSVLRIAFLALVLVLAIYQFSETTVDPDLWGHVVFGQQMLKARAVERIEVYSWTVNGQPFINHEYGADLIFGATHLLLGGSGILLLKVAVGLLTFGLALRLGMTSLSWPGSAVALALGAVAVTEISFGFAARPQIFTALGLATELWLLRRIHKGQTFWALALPVLFIIWINIHGGALAGVGLLGLAAGSTTLQFLWRRHRGFWKISVYTPASSSREVEVQSSMFDVRCSMFDVSSVASFPQIGTVIALWLATLGVLASLCCNPWGPELVRWLIKSVFWFRPEIEEWNPTPFEWDHAALFILIVVSIFAWCASRRPRRLWELAVCGAFALLALRSVRNT